MIVFDFSVIVINLEKYMYINNISFAGNINNDLNKKTLKTPLNSKGNYTKENKNFSSDMYNSSPFAVKIILLTTLLLSLFVPKGLPQKALNNAASSSKPASDVYNPSVDVMTTSSFDYIQENIKNMQEQLTSQDMKDADINNTKKMIEALYKKQEEQNQVAKIYTDGENVYLYININQENDDIKDKYEFGINIESLKKLFDIEDGGIENNNELSVRDDAYGKYGNDSYKDYTQNWFHNGDIVKVPISSIQTDNINLTGYYPK